MATITAMKWVPPFAAGQVRDHRLRWMLKELGLPYDVDLVDAPTMASPGYRAQQPFGQVPVLREDGRPPLFESGGIVLDLALRHGRLLPEEAGQRSLAICWLVAALNSVEPSLMNVAETAYFTRDEAQKALRRPVVEKAAKRRLRQLQDALGAREWLAGDAFSVADLMMSSVLKIGERLGLLEDFPALRAYQRRCFARPSHAAAIAEQCATIDAHAEEDMRHRAAKADG